MENGANLKESIRMATHTVKAYPETCEVHVYQRSKSVWIASGQFMGEQLEQRGRSESAAVRLWKEIAEWRYRSS